MNSDPILESLCDFLHGLNTAEKAKESFPDDPSRWGPLGVYAPLARLFEPQINYFCANTIPVLLNEGYEKWEHAPLVLTNCALFCINPKGGLPVYKSLEDFTTCLPGIEKYGYGQIDACALLLKYGDFSPVYSLDVIFSRMVKMGFNPRLAGDALYLFKYIKFVQERLHGNVLFAYCTDGVKAGLNRYFGRPLDQVINGNCLCELLIIRETLVNERKWFLKIGSQVANYLDDLQHLADGLDKWNKYETEGANKEAC